MSDGPISSPTKTPPPSSKNLDKLLTNYPLEFKSYIKSIAPTVKFLLDAASIGSQYQQWKNLKSKKILPGGEEAKVEKKPQTNQLDYNDL